MKKKKILLVASGPIYPFNAGCQASMFHQTKRLSQDHEVDVVAQVPDLSFFRPEKTEKVESICNKYIPILAPHKINLMTRAINKFKFLYQNKFNHIPSELFYFSSGDYLKKVAAVANAGKYDIINCQYWFSCAIYDKLNYKPYFALDTHNVNHQKYELNLNPNYSKEEKEQKVNKFVELELMYTGMNDCIVAVSNEDYEYFKKEFPDKTVLKINSGREIENFLDYKVPDSDEKVILFYGGMGGQQNVISFKRLYENIYPSIKKAIPEVKLYVVGANPPPHIKDLDNGNDIRVLGYVEDIKEWISKASIKIIPLDVGGGFRTRVVEVMAIGIPVVGTANALDCMEMENGVHGYIDDSDQGLIDHSIELLNNKTKRNDMSKNVREFVKHRFTIDATYGSLSKHFLEL